MPVTSRDPEDRYFGVFRTPAVLVWNEKLVAPADVPRDWDDLLTPRVHAAREHAALGRGLPAFGREQAVGGDPRLPELLGQRVPGGVAPQQPHRDRLCAQRAQSCVVVTCHKIDTKLQEK